MVKNSKRAFKARNVSVSEVCYYGFKWHKQFAVLSCHCIFTLSHSLASLVTDSDIRSIQQRNALISKLHLSIFSRRFHFIYVTFNSVTQSSWHSWSCGNVFCYLNGQPSLHHSREKSRHGRSLLIMPKKQGTSFVFSTENR